MSLEGPVYNSFDPSTSNRHWVCSVHQIYLMRFCLFRVSLPSDMNVCFPIFSYVANSFIHSPTFFTLPYPLHISFTTDNFCLLLDCSTICKTSFFFISCYTLTSTYLYTCIFLSTSKYLYTFSYPFPLLCNCAL